MVRVAIPLTEGRFSEHFGGAEAFGLYDVDEAEKRILTKTVVQAPPHERGAFPRWLYERGAEVILAGGMGPRALQMFDQFGIRVVAGVAGGEPAALVESFMDGTLAASGEACSGGRLHKCGDH